ncbi:MAG: hypothetical protein DME26_14890, partial [Verrucomicrobia bacterium]
SIVRANVVAAFLCATSLLAQSIGQWDFDSGNLLSTPGSTLGDLQYADILSGGTQGATQFGTTTSFGIPNIAGTEARVMKFPAANNGLGYVMPTPPANGRGQFVDNYTLIFDVLYPAEANGKVRPFINTDNDEVRPGAGADLIVNTANAIGAPNGPFHGQISTNTWYRIGFVLRTNELRKYIDGVEVGVQTAVGGQGVFPTLDQLVLSPSAAALILSNTGTNGATAGYVNSIQIRDTALTIGQMAALGGASAAGIPQTLPSVPSFILTRTPGVAAANVPPSPNIQVVINQGDTTVNSNSIQLSLDGTIVPALVTPTPPSYAVAYSVTNLLDPGSVHTLKLVYQDSVAGSKTNIWSFTVVAYGAITLPAPFAFENFDGVAEGTFPSGWIATNNTTKLTAHPGIIYTDPQSDAFLDWVVITTTDLRTAKGGAPLVVPPIAVNGVLLTAMASNQLAYAESDSRSGNQVQALFSPDFNCTGKTNVYLSFHSIYAQNQDSLGAVEYSIDQGVTWQPALYMLQCCVDSQDSVADVHRLPDGTIDAFATMNFVDGGEAYAPLPYGAFIGVESNRWSTLAPFISPRTNDDLVESIRVEVLRLAKADGQAKVRLRFLQTGTGSWWFGIDDVGLYTISTPTIATQPTSLTVDAGTSATFSVTAAGDPPLTYQWQKDGNNIANATNQSYTIASTQPGDAGQYKVIVRNASGPTPSAPATLTVITTPVFTLLPLSQVADPGAVITITAGARGGVPLSLQWYFNGARITGAVSNSLTLNSVQTTNSGSYLLVASNSFGSVTSAVARVIVFADLPNSGSITQGLVVHLTFDNTLNDSSGRSNNATYNSANGLVTKPAAPTYVAGKIGPAFQFTTALDASKIEFATLGYPSDLKFGATSDWSVAFWIFNTNSAGDPAFFANKNWFSSANAGWGVFSQGGGNFRVQLTDSKDTSLRIAGTRPEIIRDGAWHHLVVTLQVGGSRNIYLDGVLTDTAANPITGGIDTDNLVNGSGQPFAVNIGQDGTGAYNDSTANPPPALATGGDTAIINAAIDDVGIWRRTLTPQEVQGIYIKGVASNDLTTASAGLVVKPSIAIQPLGQTVSPGTNVTFSVAASGTAPLSYQWQKNGANISVTTSNLTLTAVQTNATGDYRV